MFPIKSFSSLLFFFLLIFFPLAIRFYPFRLYLHCFSLHLFCLPPPLLFFSFFIFNPFYYFADHTFHPLFSWSLISLSPSFLLWFLFFPFLFFLLLSPCSFKITSLSKLFYFHILLIWTMPLPHNTLRSRRAPDQIAPAPRFPRGWSPDISALHNSLSNKWREMSFWWVFIFSLSMHFSIFVYLLFFGLSVFFNLWVAGYN